ncbi:hypothetical protein AURDEDRAFT_177229 [Auricularia subglabra TFB-10046 SS5]|uniref:Uncharacterized protein n=1 Tax=Auricularia subglabra (strain TFB-10046 / SS5) TaxID=717982 RepID=J0D4L4_AURST|nr:hypothetical protein AURDEDRAFT_177229 [Auricularia subglabra TFB-10046 SS5]
MQTYSDINNALQAACGREAPVVAGVSWSENGNLVLMAREDMRAADIIKHAKVIIEAARFKGAVYPREDAVWHKVALREVPTRGPDGDMLSESAILENLRITSPTFVALSLVDAPNPVQWCSPPGPRASIDRSSMTVALTSPEHAQALLRLQKIHVFGARCKITKFEERDSLTPCTNCWSPVARHRPSRCPSGPRCRICAGERHTDDHRCAECSTATDGDVDMTRAAPAACEHIAAKCVNCKGAHVADDPRCPYRKKVKGTNASLPSMSGADKSATEAAPKPRRRSGARKKRSALAPAEAQGTAPAGAQPDDGWIQEPPAMPQAVGSSQEAAERPAAPNRQVAEGLTEDEEAQRRYNTMANAMHAEFPKCSKDCLLAVEMSGGDVRRALEFVKAFYNDHGMTVPGAKKLAAIAARFEKKSGEGRDDEPKTTRHQTICRWRTWTTPCVHDGTTTTTKSVGGACKPVKAVKRTERPRVLTFYRIRAGMRVIPRYDVVEDLDAMAVEVRQQGRRPILLINVYNEHPLHDDEGGADRRQRTQMPTTVQRLPCTVVCHKIRRSSSSATGICTTRSGNPWGRSPHGKHETWFSGCKRTASQF